MTKLDGSIFGALEELSRYAQNGARSVSGFLHCKYLVSLPDGHAELDDDDIRPTLRHSTSIMHMPIPNTFRCGTSGASSPFTWTSRAGNIIADEAITHLIMKGECWLLTEDSEVIRGVDELKPNMCVIADGGVRVDGFASVWDTIAQNNYIPSGSGTHNFLLETGC